MKEKDIQSGHADRAHGVLVCEHRTEADPVIKAADPAFAIRARGPVPPSLRRFIWDIQSMVELAESEREVLLVGRDLMARLLVNDDCLPTVFATAHAADVHQFQIYRDGLQRFTVTSTVLPAGMALPITSQPVWEIFGVLRGAVTRQGFEFADGGRAYSPSGPRALEAGTVDLLPSASGGARRLANALGDQVSIGIHVYGGDIGTLTRRVIASDGRLQEYVSGYANPEHAPPYDIWSIQAEILD